MASQRDDKLLAKLKKMLISRDEHLQASAAKYICANLEGAAGTRGTYEALVEYLVANDVCVYLGEACGVVPARVLGRLLPCLQKMSESRAFYERSHACHVASSMIRAARYYMDERWNDYVIQGFAYFLAEMFSRVKEFGLVPILSKDSNFDTVQILTMIREMISPPDTKPDTLLVASKLLHTLVDANAEIDFNAKTLQCVHDVIAKVLTSLDSLLKRSTQELENYFNCTFGMICHIGIDALVVLNVAASHSSSQAKRIKSDENNLDLFRSTYEIIKLLCVKIKTHETLLDAKSFAMFMKFVNTFFHKSMNENVLYEFSKLLARENFLVFLPKTRARSNDQAFRKLCLMNLSELIIVLSSKSFNFSQWNGGMMNFRTFIYEGLLDNESDLNDWPKSIYDKTSSSTKVNALIMYFYFYSTSEASSEHFEKKLLPHIIYYVLEISLESYYPLPLVKCLLLIFAIASSHNFTVANVKCERLTVENANEKIVSLIMPNIRDVYTHHRAIIEWVYSSTRIPNSVQNEVLQLWIENEKELPPNLLTLSSVWWTLFDLIQIGVDSIIQDLTRLLKNCLDNFCDEESANKIKLALWQYLPDALANFIGGSLKKEETLGCLMDLCSSYVPQNVEMDIVQRTTFYLIEVLPLLDISNSDVMCSYMSEAYCLLRISLKSDSSIVLSRYTSCSHFMECLERIMKTSTDTYLTISTYSILSLAMKYQGQFNINSEKPITVHPYAIASILRMDSENEKCKALLQLATLSFQIGRTHPRMKPIVKISVDNSYESKVYCFQSLFIRLQMVCCKDVQSVSEGAWQCMNAMLQFSATSGDRLTTVALTNNPWTHVLFRYHLQQNEPHAADKKFLRFARNWLKCARIVHARTGRPLCKYDLAHRTKALLLRAFGDDATRERQAADGRAITEGVLRLLESFV